MVIDPAVAEGVQEHARLRRDEQDQQGGAPAEQPARSEEREGRVEAEEQRRPQRRGDSLREGAPENRCQAQDQPGEGQIDQARPMRRDAGGGQHPVLHGVEPALSGQEVAHPDEAHHVVGIGQAQPVEHRREVARIVEAEQRDQHQKDHQQGVVEG